MRINHNISAQWANTNLKRADRRMSSALQSLSSGYKINKAADDSVGLAISNKMRAQIRSLDQASRNADDGESIIQTVDGSLAEIQKVVQRLRELSVQAASDTYVIDDRDSMQKEMNSLMDEIDRIASTTEFNGKGLLDGSSSRATTSTNYIFSVVSVSEQVKAADYDIELTGQASNATASIEYTIPADGKSTIEINGVSIEIESTDTSDDVKEKVLAVCNKMEIDVSTGNAANSFNLATKAAGSLQSITYRSFNDTETHVTRGTDAQVKLTDRNGNILTDGIAYHGNGEFQFIGTLQPNKVKYIIDKVTLIHAVDRYSLLKEIEKQAAKRDLEMPVLIQVNIAKEDSKHGFEVEEIDEVFSNLKDYPHVKVRGLMMMAPHIESSETERYFKMTQELLKRLQKDYPMYQLDQLSMGMSNDYHEALKHGSTMIRIGSALFK